MFISLYLFLICVIFVLYLRFRKDARLIFRVPQSKKAIPVFGDAFRFVNLNTGQIFQEYRNIHQEADKGIIMLHALYSFWLLYIYEPNDLEIVLSNSKYNDKLIPYNYLYPWLANGLLTANGEIWHRKRKLLTPAFHFNILKKFWRSFKDQTEDFVKSIQNKKEDKTDLSIILKHTLRVITETAMGYSVDEEETKTAVDQYFNSVSTIGECLVHRNARAWLYSDAIYSLYKESKINQKAIEEADKFTYKIIKERREYRETHACNIDDDKDEELYGKKGRLAMLDMLLQNEKEGKIDAKGIREEVNTFVFAGHDTTATALMFFLMAVANEPKVQALLHKEIDEVFGKTDRAATIDDLTELKYLECCIKESLRLYPSVPTIVRSLTSEVTLSGYTIPKDTTIIIPIYDIHRRADQFPNPEVFNPERFFPENSMGRHRYAYIPFSAGPRNCIGQKFAMMELKTFLSGVLRRFRIEPVTRPQDLVFQLDMTLRTEDPIYVRFVKR